LWSTYTLTHTLARADLTCLMTSRSSLGRSLPPSAEAYPYNIVLLANDRPSTEFAVYTRYSNTGSGMPATGGVVYYVENSEYTKTSKSCLNLRKTACLYTVCTYYIVSNVYTCITLLSRCVSCSRL